MMDACVEDGATSTKDERDEVEDCGGDEIIPGTETKVTVDPKEKCKQYDGDVMCCFEELVAVVSVVYVSAGCLLFIPCGTHLIGPILMILRYAWGMSAATPVQ